MAMGIDELTCSLSRIAKAAIHERVFPGCVIGVVTAAGERLVLPFGRHTYDRDATAVRPDSIYDVASVTKAIPVSCAAVKALEQGTVALDARLVDRVPEYRAPGGERVTLWHLLTHTLDHGIRLSALKELPAGELLQAILDAGLRSEPGKVFAYANATSILLGMMVERIYGKPLDVVARELFFEPLGMSDTTFAPRSLPRERIVPTEDDSWRGGVVRGVVHDESAFVLRSIMTPGSAGLFSTAPDLLRFVEALLRSGSRGGMFTARTLERMGTNQVPHLATATGLGWELGRRDYMGDTCSDCTIGKTGFTGCVVMGDIRKRVGLVMLSNHTWPHRRADRSAIGRVRREVGEVVFMGQEG
jgi:CubicO group peptidase (beta-lactamase class C family)